MFRGLVMKVISASKVSAKYSICNLCFRLFILSDLRERFGGDLHLITKIFEFEDRSTHLHGK